MPLVIFLWSYSDILFYFKNLVLVLEKIRFTGFAKKYVVRTCKGHQSVSIELYYAFMNSLEVALTSATSWLSGYLIFFLRGKC